ncbi:MAG: hypothetical protein K2N70_07555 [Helicobacter sp.]|nr:hypothetical protein [Helicobacter sp.]
MTILEVLYQKFMQQGVNVTICYAHKSGIESRLCRFWRFCKNNLLMKKERAHSLTAKIG